MAKIPEKRWSIDLEDVNVRAVTLSVMRGEAWNLRVHITQGGLPFPNIGAVTLYWRPYGKPDSFGWWSRPGTFDPVTGEVCAEFNSDCDDGSSAYVFYISFTVPEAREGKGGRSYSARGVLRVMASPGATPNEIAPPVKVLDFDEITVLNAPYILNHGRSVINTFAEWSLEVEGVNHQGRDVAIVISPEQFVMRNWSDGISVTIDYGSILIGKPSEGRTRIDDRGVSWVQRTAMDAAVIDETGTPVMDRIDFRDIMRENGRNRVMPNWSVGARDNFELTTSGLRFGREAESSRTVYEEGGIRNGSNFLSFPLVSGGEILTRETGAAKITDEPPIEPINVWDATDIEVREKLNECIQAIRKSAFAIPGLRKA